MKKKIEITDIFHFLDYAARMEEIAKAVMAWRQAMLEGRLDKAQGHLTTMSILADKELMTLAETELHRFTPGATD
jgi:hypothetical protein